MPFLVSATRSFPSSLLLPALNLKSDVASSMLPPKACSQNSNAESPGAILYFASALRSSQGDESQQGCDGNGQDNMGTCARMCY